MDTVSLLSEISILKRYIEWLETSLASYEPDWICDKMGDKDLCHDWCYANCGTEAWTHDCFKKYYDNFVADRKTENCSEKPNNCEHITEDGVTCAKYPACDDCLDNPLNKVKGSERLVKGSEQTDCLDRYDRKTEPTSSKMELVETMSCQECKHFHENAVMYLDQCDFCFKDCKYEPKDEPQTDCAWKKGE